MSGIQITRSVPAGICTACFGLPKNLLLLCDGSAEASGGSGSPVTAGMSGGVDPGGVDDTPTALIEG